MPSLPTLALFAAAALGLLLVPGPAVIFIVTRSAAHGRRAGLASVAGVEIASLIHSLAAAFGLSAILLASATAFQVVKYAGAAYLVYLGVRALVSRDESEEKPLDTQTGLGRHLARGIVVNLLNPKTALFFYAFLPQFVDPAKGPVQAQIFFLGALFVALATCTDGLYSLFASSVGKLVLARPGIRRARRFVSAGVYFALGAVTAATGAHRK